MQTAPPLKGEAIQADAIEGHPAAGQPLRERCKAAHQRPAAQDIQQGSARPHTRTSRGRTPAWCGSTGTIPVTVA